MRIHGVSILLLTAGALSAQLGGPLGGDPFPKGPSEQNTKGTVRNSNRLITSLRGTFRAEDNGELYVEAEDKRLLVIKTTKTTEFWKNRAKVKKIDFEPGDQLVIDATQDETRKFVAVSVVFDRPGTEAEKESARQPLPETDFHRAQNVGSATKGDAPKGKPEKAKDKDKEAEEQPEPVVKATTKAVPADNDPDRPKLTRNRRPAPASPAPPPPEEAVQIVASAAPPKPAAAAAPAVVLNTKGEFDPFLDKVREEIEKYVGTLPNYVVKQLTTRYASTNSKGEDWRPLDHVTADIVVEDGKERYLNQSKKAGDGAWSTGEFVTILRDLFSMGTNAEFRYRGVSSMQKRPARLYDFKVPQERSHWHIVTPGQRFFPAYKGSVWIDKETARPLRIEMQGRDIPEQFPIDTVESATDYDFVNIGGAMFLLPVKSEMLTCPRGGSECSLNRIEYRNYKKFGAKTDITF